MLVADDETAPVQAADVVRNAACDLDGEIECLAQDRAGGPGHADCLWCRG